jgi:ATP-binding cassette, subfamily B, bacterial
MSRLRESVERLRYIPPAAAIVWRAAGGWTVLSLSILLVQGTLPAGLVYLTKHLVDGIAAAMSMGPTREAVDAFALPAVLMGAIMMLTQVLEGASRYVNAAQAELVQDQLKLRIHQQASALDMAFFEASTSYDILNQANTQASGAPLELINNFGTILRHFVTLLAIAGLLIPYGLWLPLFLVVSTVPAFLIVLRFNRIHHAWWMSRTADRRRAQYYDMLLTLDTSAPEIRLFDLGRYFSGEYRSVRRTLREENLRLLRQQGLAQFGAAALALLLSAGALAWILWRSLLGFYTLGDIALFYQAFNQGQGLLRSLLGSIGQIHRNLLFLENLFTFLNFEAKVYDPATPALVPRRLQQGIRFENVTFRYPNAERPALENFDIFLPAGRTTAIVGENGAGKSTLVKLICRFYDPEAGRITLDGVDLREFSRAELWTRIAPLFQFPIRYQATASQNISVGDREADGQAARVQHAARQALIHDAILRLPQQYDTHLGKWFGHGSELSGGEWQRITLARAFFRDAPIVVLDEPTSAMDSWAENQWLERFAEVARGRTALVITHRFTTAIRADLIYVMDRGRVLESGTHHDLLTVRGHYARSWDEQMSRHFLADEVAGAARTPDSGQPEPLRAVLGG